MSLSLTGSRSKTSLIGLDIGASGVRAVQLTNASGAWTLTQATRSSVDGSGGEGADNPQPLGLLVKRCMQQARFRGRFVNVGVNPPKVEFHALELPQALLAGGGESVCKVVENEVARLMTFTEGSVETRHWTLPSTSVPAPNAIGVAASREAIEEVLVVCGEAGLECQGVDTTAGALCRFGMALHPWSDEDIWGLLDLGERQARLIICVGNTPILVRAIGGGGRAWTELIAESLQISFAAAEVHKRDNGVALTLRGMGPQPASAPSSELSSIILGVLRSELNKLATEVKRSYEYVLGCYPQKRATDLVLVGGGALMCNVAEFMSQALGIKVCSAGTYLENEGCRLRCSLSPRDPLERYAAAVGLALGPKVMSVQS